MLPLLSPPSPPSLRRLTNSPARDPSLATSTSTVGLLSSTRVASTIIGRIGAPASRRTVVPNCSSSGERERVASFGVEAARLSLRVFALFAMGDDAEPEPEATERVQRLPEPDRDVHKAAVQKIQDEIAKKQERMVSPRFSSTRESADSGGRGRTGRSCAVLPHCRVGVAPRRPPSGTPSSGRATRASAPARGR